MAIYLRDSAALGRADRERGSRFTVIGRYAIRFPYRPLLCCEGPFSDGLFSGIAARDAVKGEGALRRSSVYVVDTRAVLAGRGKTWFIMSGPEAVRCRMAQRTIGGEFHVTGWDEQTLAELGPGAKLAQAKVTQKFVGGMGGQGDVVWLMCYTSPMSARFVGMQRFVGTLGDRAGGFVLETEGDFDGSTAKGRWTIVSDSGTGGLAGIKGKGTFEAPHGPKATYALEYILDGATASR